MQHNVDFVVPDVLGATFTNSWFSKAPFP